MLVAHRGFRKKSGENRLVDFENSLKFTKAVEFDIRLSKDKQVVIFHDKNFKRIAKNKKFVKSLNYKDFESINFFNKFPKYLPPRLIEEFGKKVADKFKLIIVEIKNDNYSQKDYFLIKNALEKLRKLTKAEIIVSAFEKDDLNFINTLDKDYFKTGYLVSKIKNFDKVLAKNFDYIHPSIKILKNKKTSRIILDTQKPLNVWTFKKNKDYKIINRIYEKNIYCYISDLENLFE